MRGCFGVVFTLGVLLVIGGAIVVGLVPWLVEEGVRASVKMESPSSSLYDSFKNSSAKGVEVYKSWNVYHVKNCYAVEHEGAVPDMQVFGPFTYREFETYNESVTSWFPNATFRYRSFTTYQYQPDGQLDVGMTVCVPRFSFWGLIKKIRYLDRTLLKNNVTQEWWADVAASFLLPLATTSPFVNITVHQLLRSGYLDELTATIAKLENTTVKATDFAMMPDDTPEDYETRGDDEAYTGGEPSKTQPPVPDNSYRQMTMFEGNTSMTYWLTDEANRVGGTDATAFHPFIDKGEALQVWVNVLTRKVMLSYQKEVKVQGVTCYRHIIDPAELKSEASVPANAAYYMTKDGFLPSPSKTMAPVNFSKPYFMDCDTVGMVNITGLETIAAAHSRDDLETTLDIEPMTGGLFAVHKRLQVNVPIGPFAWEDTPAAQRGACLWNLTWHLPCTAVKGVWPQTKKLPSTMVPFVWLDQHMELPSKIVNDLKKEIFTPLLLSKVLGGAAIAVGGVLVIATIVAFVLAKRREERNYREHEFYLVNSAGGGNDEHRRTAQGYHATG